ncbi:hypothetical protein FI667_g13419, partial [Globisporangium splendens]
MVYKRVTLDITPAQLRKAADGKQITLSATQLKGSGATFHVHPANHEKIMKAKRAGRRTRIFIAPGAINHDLMHGGSLWSWLKDKAYPWVKKNWDVIKPVVSRVADVAIPAAATFLGQPAAAAPARAALSQLTGVGVSKKKLTKGSPEMKAHMAALRPKRKGGSFRLS